MVLTEKGRAPRIREVVTYRLDKSGGETANLIRFLDPDDIAGTGLLSIDKADGSTDQWLYLPALDRVRRISSERRGGRFVGSDLYFEDLQERKPTKDRHRLLGKQTEGGILCEVLESVPADAERVGLPQARRLGRSRHRDRAAHRLFRERSQFAQQALAAARQETQPGLLDHYRQPHDRPGKRPRNADGDRRRAVRPETARQTLHCHKPSPTKAWNRNIAHEQTAADLEPGARHPPAFAARLAAATDHRPGCGR
ncbi:MAG: outer membrane lipoprotein-sorting protein [Comamonadaceae bacterium]|nr:outer membrane lipoprotein-sorting protein [Comamonadaceae bacterium]